MLFRSMLGFHLWHGVWSMFQTLGSSQPKHESFGRWFATIFTLLVVLGFTAVPLAIYSGVVHERGASPSGIEITSPLRPNR